MFRCVDRELGCTVFDIADIDVNQKLTHRKAVKYGIQEVRRLSQDKAQVVFGFASFLDVDGTHISMKRKAKGSWSPTIIFETLGSHIIYSPLS